MEDEEDEEEGGPEGSGQPVPPPPLRGGVVTMPEPGVCGVAGRIGVHGPIPTWRRNQSIVHSDHSKGLKPSVDFVPAAGGLPM